jgi:hypothetical protein
VALAFLGPHIEHVPRRALVAELRVGLARLAMGEAARRWGADVGREGEAGKAPRAASVRSAVEAVLHSATVLGARRSSIARGVTHSARETSAAVTRLAVRNETAVGIVGHALSPVESGSESHCAFEAEELLMLKVVHDLAVGDGRGDAFIVPLVF